MADSNQIANQFSGLPIENLIAAPLLAASEGQKSLASSTASFITEVGLDDKGNTKSVTFNYEDGSEKRILHDEMIGYPSTYITTVGLYQADTRNGGNVLVAVGRLSGPVEKNYGTEATIKVKLTY